MDSSGVAVAVITGGEDRALNEYRAGYQKLELPKSFIIIEGTAHHGMMDSVTRERSKKRGEPYQIVPSTIAAGRFARWAGLFLRAHMYEDPYAQQMIFQSGEHEGVIVESARGSATDAQTQEQEDSDGSTEAMSDVMVSALTNISSSKEAARDAMINVGIGAIAQDNVGGYMDQQDAKLRERLEGTGVTVTRAGDKIILELPGKITFANDSADLNGSFHTILDNIALVVNEFEKTYINIDGHSDRAGSHTENMTVSQNFADSVASYMIDQQVMSQRLIPTGFGEYRPITEDSTSEGRQLNRRVEIQLTPLI